MARKPDTPSKPLCEWRISIIRDRPLSRPRRGGRFFKGVRDSYAGVPFSEAPHRYSELRA
jgi:hypothetical protein